MIPQEQFRIRIESFTSETGKIPAYYVEELCTTKDGQVEFWHTHQFAREKTKLWGLIRYKKMCDRKFPAEHYAHDYIRSVLIQRGHRTVEYIEVDINNL